MDIRVVRARIMNEKAPREEFIQAALGGADRLTLAVMKLEGIRECYRDSCEKAKELRIKRDSLLPEDGGDEDEFNRVQDEFIAVTDLGYDEKIEMGKCFQEVLDAQAECCPPMNHKALLAIAKHELQRAEKADVPLLEKAVAYHRRMAAAA